MYAMRRARLAIVGLLAACQGAPGEVEISQPVVGAEIDTGDPAVVALVFSTDVVFCTGTLVSPRVVLTAAHCIDDGSSDPNFAVYFGPDVASQEGIRVGVVDKQKHPMWNGDLAGGHDSGVLLLAAAQDPALAVPLNTADIADHLGAEYRVVGFGIHDAQTRELDGKKRQGMMSIARLQGDYLEAEDPDTIICQGDSGGPGFLTLDGVEYVAGTHSYSIEGCLNPSGDARVDLWEPEFIRPYIQQHDTTCGRDGLCARVGCVDDPDCEPCGADGTCATGCAVPDVDCRTQEVGEICQADTQCLSELCLFWPEDPHSEFCSMPCSAPGDCPEGMTCRTRQPFGDVCDYVGEPPGALGQACDDPTDCSQYDCEEGSCTYECDVGRGLVCPTGFECDTHDGTSYRCWSLPEEGGCCSIPRGSRGPTAGMLLLVALVALCLSRGRRRPPLPPAPRAACSRRSSAGSRSRRRARRTGAAPRPGPAPRRADPRAWR
jgi:V8-like Glu-specific endopeptidase